MDRQMSHVINIILMDVFLANYIGDVESSSDISYLCVAINE